MGSRKSTVCDWLEARLPLRLLMRTFIEETIPGGPSWAYVFGSVCLALLGVQFLTGIALAFFYVPSPDHALPSITSGSDEIPLGRVVLGLHHWSANIFVGIIGFHLLQTFIWGAYKRPREFVWWSGIGFLLLVQGFHFTGFTVPWDQKGYWATEVGLRLQDLFPLLAITF